MARGKNAKRVANTLLPRSDPLRADRATMGLAAAAVATAGLVIGGEVMRLAHQRESQEA